ncbi:cytochrome c-type biogenesis protein [Marinobacter confluentis]|uniref:Cytochrome c-type biogenesis protein n=1 Tax=Marinobacter confluentis TaxID=1697557 RepID=A0A4Z1BEY9_9GAMM|nr:cytochrome c-type biogenesis protein [Marinobacter confluentis]TGN41264.1 cytochrome c-type biogenesis protein CcmH [Marinobacter confluentis]
MTAPARVGILLALMLSSVSVFGQSQDVYQFDSREQEQRFQTLIAELRCPKCQNQNIADSNAPISKDMREAVYRMMSDGASNEEITNALVSRFGEFVRYKPEVDSRTIMLWATPALVVFIGVVVVLLTVRRSGRAGPAAGALTDEERARASRLLYDEDQNDRSS